MQHLELKLNGKGPLHQTAGLCPAQDKMRKMR